MKKSLSLLSLALAAGLFFVGCTQPTNTTTTTTSGTTTTTTAASSVPSDATAIFDAYGLTALPSSFTAPAWNATTTLEDDSTYGKVLKVACSTEGASYSYATITFSTPLNLTGKTVYAVVKGSGVKTTGSTNGMKVIVISDATHQSENTNYEPSDASAFTTKSAAISDWWTTWSADNSISAADVSAITSMQINFQTLASDVYIASIYYK